MFVADESDLDLILRMLKLQLSSSASGLVVADFGVDFGDLLVVSTVLKRQSTLIKVEGAPSSGASVRHEPVSRRVNARCSLAIIVIS